MRSFGAMGKRHSDEEPEESPLAPFADLIVGVLFIFILIVVYQALERRQGREPAMSIPFNEAQERLSKFQADLDARQAALDGVQQRLDDQSQALDAQRQQLAARDRDQSSRQAALDARAADLDQRARDLQQQQQDLASRKDSVGGSRTARNILDRRAEVLLRIQTELLRRHIVTVIDLKKGVLQIPNSAFFSFGNDPEGSASDTSSLRTEHQVANLVKLASVLGPELYCHVPRPINPRACDSNAVKFSSVRIETHMGAYASPSNKPLSEFRLQVIKEVLAKEMWHHGRVVAGIRPAPGEGVFPILDFKSEADNRRLWEPLSLAPTDWNNRIELHFVVQ